MIVLDASALVDVLVGQANARWVLDRMEGQEILAPAHQPAEVLSAVARLERAGVLGADDAREALAAAGALPQELVVPSTQMVSAAFDLRDRLRVLDALYVVLARDRDVPLLTTDHRLLRADPPCEVLAP